MRAKGREGGREEVERWRRKVDGGTQVKIAPVILVWWGRWVAVVACVGVKSDGSGTGEHKRL